MEKMVERPSNPMDERRKFLSEKANLKEMERELQCCVSVIKYGVEKLSMERDGELWAELGIVLEEWREV